MDINTSIYGTPDTWYTPSADYGSKPATKLPTWGNGYYNHYYFGGFNEGVFEANGAPVDNSLALWGINKDASFARPYFFFPSLAVDSNYNYTTDPEIHTLNVLTDENATIPMTAAVYGSGLSIRANSTPDAQYTPNASTPLQWTQAACQPILDFKYNSIVLLPYIIAARDTTGSDDSGLDFAEYNIPDYFDNGGQQAYPYIVAVNARVYISTSSINPRSENSDALKLWYSKEYAAHVSSWQGTFTKYIAPYYSVQPMGTLRISGGYNNSIDSSTNYNFSYNESFTTESEAFARFSRIGYTDSLVVVLDNGKYQYKVVPNRGYCTVTSIWENATKDEVMKEVAYLGFWFCDDRTTAINAANGQNCTDDKMHIPLLDEDGITTGEWLSGTDAAAVAPPDDETARGIAPDYDPNKTTPSGDDEGDEGIKVRPSTPGFTLAGRGTMCYELLESDIDEIFDDIYGRDNKSWNKLIKGLQMFGSDPMGAIISFKWYPFTFNPGESKAVYLGNTAVNPLHQYPTVDGINKAYVSTTATFRWDKPKNFVNSRYTKCRIYLPFYGFYELPISMMISKTLSVYMAYNVPDETAVWILSFDDVIYDFCECDPSIEIPLTGSNAGQIALVKRQAALSIAAQVAAIAGTAIVGAQAGSGLAYLGYTASDSLVFSGALSPVIAEDVTKTLNAMAGRSVAGAGVSGLGSLGNIYNTVQNAKLQIGTLQTNLPHHGAASATTFLNLPMYPYIQFIQNVKIQGYNEGQYKLKVGHACDIWTTMNSMPDNSLLQTTGMADMSSSGMELSEITELNSILQTGFYK